MPTTGTLTMAPEGEAILAVAREEVAAAAEGDAARYVATLTDDALFLPPNQPPRQGSDLREWLRRFLDQLHVAWLEYRDEECVISGDLAFHRYSYRWEVRPREGGPAAASSGKGLHLLACQPDGRWKIHREMWNGNPEDP
jgi:ketosteroid isomerase-like protein